MTLSSFTLMLETRLGSCPYLLIMAVESSQTNRLARTILELESARLEKVKFLNQLDSS